MITPASIALATNRRSNSTNINSNSKQLLGGNTLDSFTRLATVKQFSKGSFIYFPKDVADKVFIIKSGRVKIGAYSQEGKEVIRNVLTAGEIFGELSILGENRRTEFAQAMEDVSLYMLSTSNMKDLMHHNPMFSLQITQMIGRKLKKAQQRLESQVFKSAKSRIIEFLTNLAKERGQRVGYELLVRQFLTHQEIANLTGTSRQTVTTILNELRTKNYIYFNRKRLLVRDINQLAALANKR